MTIGITEDGFVIETLDQIRTSLITRLRGRWGDVVDFGNESAVGHLVGIVAERFAILQELCEAIYRSFSRDTAVDDGLVNINMMSGTEPRGAFPSSVTLSLTGVPATNVLTGKQAQTADLVIFQTLEDGVIAAVPARAVSTAYTLGVRRTNAGNIYVVTIPGTTGAGAGPSSTDDAILDGGVTWRFIGVGTGVVDVKSSVIDVGPQIALAGSVTIIKTPVSGWQGVRNLRDADVGAYKESDESYRLRGQDELFGAGSHTVDALRTDLLQLTGVLSARILQNTTDVVNGDGMPPHTVEALVRGGDDTEIATLLLETGIGVGYATFGNTSLVVEDGLGVDYTIQFSRPVQVPIWVALVVLVDEDTFPADGAELIKLAIVTWGDAQDTGKDVVAAAISAQAFSIPGMLDVPQCFIGIAPLPGSGTTIVLPIRSLAVYDTSQISVTVNFGTP